MRLAAIWREPATRAAVRTAIVVYVGSFLVYAVSIALLGRFSIHELAVLAVPMMVGDCLLALPLWLQLRATARLRFVPRWTLMFGAILIVSALQAGWDTWLRVLYGNALAGMSSLYYVYVAGMVMCVAYNAMFVAIIAFQTAYVELRQRQRELIAAREAERGAQLAALRLQLNPHFLFNTMNALSSLVVLGRNPEAEEMIERLSAFLRVVLEGEADPIVRIEEELNMIDAYLAIERVRFGDRLLIDISLPVELMDARVPAFLLQPLVENAVKYGVGPARRAVTIGIVVSAADDTLTIAITDDGPGGDTKGGTGLGLANARKRLALEYGERGLLESHPRLEGGYAATVTLPLIR